MALLPWLIGRARSPAAWLLASPVLFGCGPAVPTGDADSSPDGASSTSADDDSATNPGTFTTSPPETSTTPDASTSSPSSTSPSTSTSTSLGSSGSEDDGASFIMRGDGGPVCLVGPGAGLSCQCDLWAQDCSPEDKCMPWANDGSEQWNAVKCAPLDPQPAQLGEPCSVEGSGFSGVDNCDIGLMCWNVDPDINVGECVALCTGDQHDPTCPGDTTCMIANDGALVLCLPACDPLDPDTCEEGQVCAPTDDSFVCLPAGAHVLPHGVECEFPTSCSPGATCVSPEILEDCKEEPCCTPYCDLDLLVDPACAAGETCIPWYEEGQAPQGLENVGVCGAQ